MKPTIGKADVSLRILICAMMVLSCFAIISLAGTVSADVPSYAVSVSMSSPSSKNLRPGDTVQFTFTVKNDGANNDDYWLNSSCKSPESWYMKGWRAYVNPSKSGTLSFGSTKTGILTVVAPTNATYPDVAAISVSAESSHSTATSSDISLSVISATYRATITSPPEQVIAQGDVGHYTFNVTNSGNDDDQFEMSVVSYPPGWSKPTFSYSKTLLIPGGKMSVTLNAQVPYGALAQSYAIQIKATSDTNTSSSSFADISVRVKQERGVTLTVDSTKYINITPGSFVDFKVAIKNTGNGYDTYNLTYKMATIDVTRGWSCALGHTKTSPMAPNGYFNTTLTVNAPASGTYTPMAGDTVSIDVNATTTGVYTVTKARVVVNQKFELAITGTVSKTGNVSQSVKFYLNVTNMGNGQDNVKFDVPAKYGWVKPSVTPNSATVNPGAANKSAFTVTVTIPSTAKSTDPYSFIIYSNSTKSTTFDYQALTINVNQVFGVKVEPQPGYSTIVPDAFPGNIIKFPVRLKNLGNGVDDFNIDVNASSSTIKTKWNPTAEFPSITDIDPDQYFNFNVSATVPSDATSGSYTFYVNASSVGQPSKKYSLPLQAQIPQLYNVDINGKDSVSTAFSSATVTRKAYFNLTIFNKGSGSDDLKIDMSQVPSQFVGKYDLFFNNNKLKMLTVASGGVGYANLTIDIPLSTSNVSAGSYTFKIKATTENGTKYDTTDDISREKTVTLVIIPLFDVSVYTGVNSSYVKIGNKVTYDIIIENRGTQTDTYDLVKTHPDYGDKVKFTIPNANLSVKNLAPGKTETVVLTVELLSGADPSMGSVWCIVKAVSSADNRVSDSEKYTTSIEDDFAGTLSTTNNFKETDPGFTVIYNLTLKNAGTRPVDYFKIDDDGKNPFDSITITPSTFGLAANKETNITVSIKVPAIEDEIIPVGTYTINITAVSKGPTNSSDTDDVKVSNVTLKLKLNQVYSVDMFSVSADTEFVDPGAAKKFTLRLTNKGNGVDTFLLTATGAKASWASFSDGASRTLQPKQQWDFNVTVTVPDGTDSQSYLININTKSSGKSTVTKMSNITVSVEEFYDVELTETVSLTKQLDPGQQYRFEFLLTNKGTATDSYTLTIESGSYKDWVTEFGVYQNSTYQRVTTVSLTKNNAVKVWANVTVAEDAATGVKTISMKATSKEDDTVFDTIDLKPDVQPKRDLTVTSDDKEKEITPNLEGNTKASEKFNLTITNKGTATDDFDLTFSYDTAYIEVTGPSNTGSIAKDASTVIQITVKVNNKVAPRQEKIKVNVTSKAPNLQASDVIEPLELILNIEQSYKLTISCADKDMDTPETFSGDYRIVIYPIDILNSGTDFDPEIKVEVVSGTNSNWVTLDTELFSLVKDGKKTVNVTVKIPKDQTTGSYDVRIKATSAAGGSLESSSVTEQITLTTTVTQFYDMSFGVDSPASGQQKVAVGADSTFVLKIKNEGNALDTITFKITGDENNWAKLSASSKPLNPGTETTITLTVSIPSDKKEALAGKYIIGVEATSSDKKTKATISTTTEIEKAAAINLDTVDGVQNAEIEPGDSHEYQLKITNKGNAIDTYEFTKLGENTNWIKFGGNNTSSVTLSPDQSYTLLVIVTIPSLEAASDPTDIQAGDYLQQIQVMSNNDDTIKQTMDLTTTVKQVNSIELVEQTSSILVLNANDDAGVEYKFTVKNLGNDDETVTLSKEVSVTGSGTVDFTFSKTSVPLAVNQETTITATIKLQSGFKGTGFSFKITGTPSGGGSAAKDSLTVSSSNVEIRKPDLIVETFTTDSYDIDKDEKFTIKLVIKNNGKEDVKSVKVVVKDNDKEITAATKTISAIDAETSEEYSVEISLSKTGNHILRAEVDPSNTIIESSDSNNKKELEQTIKIEEANAATSNTMWIIIAIVVGIIALVIGIAGTMFFMKQSMKPEGTRDEIDSKLAEKKGAAPKSKKVAGRGGMVAADTGKSPAGPGKKVKIQCPNCQEIMTVTDPKRPLTVDCKGCGKKLVLSK